MGVVELERWSGWGECAVCAQLPLISSHGCKLKRSGSRTKWKKTVVGEDEEVLQGSVFIGAETGRGFDNVDDIKIAVFITAKSFVEEQDSHSKKK